MTPISALDDLDFYQTLAGTRGGALVFFTAPACGSCRAYRQALEAIAAEGADFALFAVDASRNLALTREYEVFHLPALFLFVNGEFHCGLDPRPAPESIRSAVARSLKQPAEEAP